MAGVFTHQVLFDFTGESSGDARWHSIDDRVMGGCSQSSLTVHDSGIAVFQGNVSGKNGGGFASVRSDPLVHRLDDYMGIAVHAKGDGNRYQVSLTTRSTGPSLYYLAGFRPSADEWYSYYLPFDRFNPKIRGKFLEGPYLDISAIESLGFMITGGQKGPFCLQIDHIWGFHEEELYGDIDYDRMGKDYI